MTTPTQTAGPELEILPKEERAAVPATSPTRALAPATPSEVLVYAMERGADLAQIEKLLELKERFEANEARKAYVADMAEFKKNPPTIRKDKKVGYENRDGTFTGYTHATLGNVTNAIVEGLARHGFSHRWDVRHHGPMVEVDCIITHRLGHSERVTMQAGKDDSGKKNQIQQVSSAITYLQRYTLLAATGLATHDQVDDDGTGAGSTDITLADKWIAKAKSAPTIAALDAVWAAGSAEITEAQDEHAYEELRQSCRARKAELEAPRQPNKSSRLAGIVGNTKDAQPGAPQ